MASPEDLRHWLRLLLSGIDSGRLGEWLRELEGPQDLLEGDDATLSRAGVRSSRDAAALRRPVSQRRLDAALSAMEAHRMRLVALGDEDYPRNLFHMRTPPAALFVKGTIEAFDALAIGIVGARRATTYGVEVARSLARDLAPHLTVVSGAALGIDSEAHEAVLNHGGRTLAVLGCGIDVNYPAANERLRTRMAAEGNGALVSIFPPGTQPLRQNFPMRNFVLAGLSLGVVVVEAAERSGALVTARAAGEEGRPVYAVPGDIRRRNSVGTNGLLRDGASVCTCAGDLLEDLESHLVAELEHLRARRVESGAEAATPPAERLPEDPHQRDLLRRIRHAPATHDELIDEFTPGTMSTGELATALLMLEMDGAIRQQPGRVYTAAL